MTIHSMGKHPLKWLFLTFCLAISVAGHAAMKPPGDVPDLRTASGVFAVAPLEVLDMLRPSTRLDMLDYYEQADSILTVTNALGGESRLVQVTPDYLKVEITPVNTLEIKIIPIGKIGKKWFVMTLYTVGDSDMAQDTEVRFFDELLNPIATKNLLKAPKLTDFFTLKGSGLDEADLREKVPYAAIKYTTGPGDEPLKATLTTLRAISREDSDLLTPILTPTLSTPWKGGYRFK